MSAPTPLGLPVLDDLDWPAHGRVAEVAAALRSRQPVDLDDPMGLVAGELPENLVRAAEAPAARVVVTDMDPALVVGMSPIPVVVLTPPTLVVGVGLLERLVQRISEVPVVHIAAVGAVHRERRDAVAHVIEDKVVRFGHATGLPPRHDSDVRWRRRPAGCDPATPTRESAGSAG